MPLLNFQKQFAEKVQSGSKRQTIRAKRKRPIKPGDTIYLYTGLRTKYCRKLREEKCKEVKDVVIFRNVLKVDQILYDGGLDIFARKDGFKNWPEMVNWFEITHKLPFDGNLITW